MRILNQEKKEKKEKTAHTPLTTCHVFRRLFMSYKLFPIYPELLVYNLM